MEVLREDRKAKRCITDVKFSAADANGTLLLAVASLDGRVFLHDGTSFAYKSVFSIPTTNSGNDSNTENIKSAVTRIDFSNDARHLRIVTASHELFYYSIESEMLIDAPMVVRDVIWDQISCPYHWMTQGNENSIVVAICLLFLLDVNWWF